MVGSLIGVVRRLQVTAHVFAGRPRSALAVARLESRTRNTRLVLAVGPPLPGNRNDCKAWELSGTKDAVGRTTVIADGGYRGTGLVIPHRRERSRTEPPDWKEAHTTPLTVTVWGEIELRACSPGGSAGG
ncbi:hypothetical protein FB563_6374 [Streptomyces puniciscabiei]|uniref:DDE superfamily endonuclease n=1 Tax=Streptomyces puniciscabiei TaxID=164348 RepID=A0A542THH4_9ACTN|nr:hypothetical protein FB563_6374 [Streptomyces puniciscabiei]